MFSNLMGRSTPAPGPPSPSNPNPPRGSTATLSGSGASAGSPGSSSDVFIRIALGQLNDAKETKKYAELRDAIKSALETLDTPSTTQPPTYDQQTLLQIFTPFRLACQTRQPVLSTISIDLL
ncbi:hypothetical protein HK097_007635, partial [Rhizophlyctis rosea]